MYRLFLIFGLECQIIRPPRDNVRQSVCNCLLFVSWGRNRQSFHALRELFRLASSCSGYRLSSSSGFTWYVLSRSSFALPVLYMLRDRDTEPPVFKLLVYPTNTVIYPERQPIEAQRLVDLAPLLTCHCARVYVQRPAHDGGEGRRVERALSNVCTR